MEVYKFIAVSLTLFLLTQCNTRQDSQIETQIHLQPVKPQPDDHLTGEWKYINTIWYSSQLTLLKNGTFKFHDQGCYGQNFSEGQWANDNGKILLTSFDNFKPVEETLVVEPVAIESPKKNKLVSFDAGLVQVPLPQMPGPGDTIRVYFDNIQLELKNDTLYFIGPGKLPDGAKFHRTKYIND